MRSKSINVHALMDESEDPLELLEAYFNSTVLNLTDTGMGSVGGINSPSFRAGPTVISPFAHHSSSPPTPTAASTAQQHEREPGWSSVTSQTRSELDAIHSSSLLKDDGSGREIV